MSTSALPQVLEKVQELIDSGEYYQIKSQTQNQYTGRCYLGLIVEAAVRLNLVDPEESPDYALLSLGINPALKHYLWYLNDSLGESYQSIHNLLLTLVQNRTEPTSFKFSDLELALNLNSSL
jgi:hypothetical protein